MSAHVTRWREQLVDLTRKNRSLNFPKRAAGVDIIDPDIDAVVAGLTQPGWRLAPIPDDLPKRPQSARGVIGGTVGSVRVKDELRTSLDATNLAKRLRTLSRRASDERMNRGLHVLYLAIGFLRWSDSRDEFASPIIFVPVELERSSPREPFRLRSHVDDPVINPSLAAKLRNEFGIELPALGEVFDPKAYLEAIRDLVVSQDVWTVEERVTLSVFSFYKEAMYQDLLSNEEAIVGHPLVRAICGERPDPGVSLDFEQVPESELDEVFAPEQLFSILDADSTQRVCIGASRSGKSFVMDGPPGSGKSQTIANVIAELLGAGKSVLFVSEKVAALDVVLKRLAKACLESFVLELHGHKASRRAVAQELGKALEERPKVSTILTPHQISDLQMTRRKLSAFAAAANEPRGALGWSFTQIVGELAPDDGLQHLPPPDLRPDELTSEGWKLIRDASEQLGQSWGPVSRAATFLWRDLADPKWTGSRLSSIRADIDELRRAIDECAIRSRVIAAELGVPEPTSISEVLRLAEVLTFASNNRSVPASIALRGLTAERQAEIQMARSRGERAEQIQKSLDNVFGSSIPSPEHATKVLAALRELSRLDLTPPPSFPLDVAEIQLVGSRMSSVVEKARALSDRLDVYAEVTGVARPSSEGALLEFEVLRDGLDGAAQPLQAWLSPEKLSEARQAKEALEVACKRYLDAQSSVSDVFGAEVLEVDLRMLTKPGSDEFVVSRLSSIGRQNRRILREVSVAGRFSRSLVQKMHNVAEFQAAANHLQLVQIEHSPALGGHYLGLPTDFKEIKVALDLAEKACGIYGAGRVTRFSKLLKDNGAMAEAINAYDSAVAAAEDFRAATTGFAPWLDRVVDNLQSEHLRDFCAAMEGLGNAFTAFDHVTNLNVTFGQLDRAFGEVLELEGINRSEGASSQQLRESYGEMYNGLDTDWRAVTELLREAETLRQLLPSGWTPSAVQDILLAGTRAEQLREPVNDLAEAEETVLRHFTADRAATYRSKLAGPISTAKAFCEDLSAGTSEVDEWLAFTEAKETLTSFGFAKALEMAERHNVPAHEVARCIRAALRRTWLDDVLGNDQRLKPYQSTDRDRAVKEFRELDVRLAHDAAARVIERCAERRPRTRIGPAGLIAKESEKKTRHMPVATLLEKVGHVALELKPCFMMSPLTVSQLLPSDFRFDVVIFDEASQIRPCDAINAIYRGNQLIVAGDQKQLPPTSFWDHSSSSETDEWDEEQIDDFDSLLDLCKGSAQIPALPLLWHYRSQHEDLISFSNYKFYEGKLITYPSAIDKAADRGVELFHVPDGVYQRGGNRDNPIEARKVVERILNHYSKFPNLSLGVVAFSEAQASRIIAELEVARNDRPDLDDCFNEDRLSGFFVKNLESVQGDERDVIIFSVGYGFDEAKNFTMEFGPITKSNGWRRLNVAVTRARHRVEVVTSIKAENFKPTTNTSVLRLKQYLDFAERGPIALAVDLGESQGDVESPFEADVLGVVRALGYEAAPQIGQSRFRIDIGVRDPKRPGRWVLGVECDGASYHSSLVARDRDRLRQQKLEDLGWTLHRIWSTSWFRNRDVEIERLRNAIECALNAGESAPQHLESPAVTVENLPPESVQVPRWVSDYEPERLPRRYSDFCDGATQAEIVEAIIQVVRAEAPICESLLLQRVQAAWNIQRSGTRVKQSFDSALSAVVDSGKLQRRHGVVSDEWTVMRVRCPTRHPDSIRDVMQVPVNEIECAVIHTVLEVQECSQDELTKSVAQLFGWKRRGHRVNLQIQAAIDGALKLGAIQIDGDQLRVPS